MSGSKKNFVFIGMGLGAVAVMLAFFGNPANMAICVACFVRDIAGSMKLHSAAPVQYFRPEVVGIVVGATILSYSRKEFKVTAGSSPIMRFILGIIMAIGALVFLGCPLRMILRMAGGDLNAFVGLIGFVGGVVTGALFLKRGFSLGKSQETNKSSGFVMPGLLIALLVLAVVAPTLFAASQEGPGSMHAPILIALVGGLLFGGLSQLSAVCFSGSIRDAFLIKNFDKLTIVGSLMVAMLVYNIVTGNFNLGFVGQPIAHNEHIWNILGLYVVGFAGVLLSGCPLRQLVLTGQGSADAGIMVVGMLIGGAMAHNFGLASSGDGTTSAGRVATIICILVLFAIALTNNKKKLIS